MHVCVIIQQLHLQRINPYSIRHFCNTRNFFYTTSQKILTCTPVITGTQCSVCAFLSAFVFISSCICVWYRAWSHLLLKSCCYQSIRSICVFVFVYLCICVFVYLYLCICVFACLEQLVAEILLLPGAETRYVIPCCLRNWQPAEPVFHKYKYKCKYKYENI